MTTQNDPLAIYPPTLIACRPGGAPHPDLEVFDAVPWSAPDVADPMQTLVLVRTAAWIRYGMRFRVLSLTVPTLKAILACERTRMRRAVQIGFSDCGDVVFDSLDRALADFADLMSWAIGRDGCEHTATGADRLRVAVIISKHLPDMVIEWADPLYDVRGQWAGATIRGY